MLEFIFTIDYEIYGNGEGKLRELIFEPTCQLLKIFDEANAKLVFFVETAELEVIDSNGTDATIDDVKLQVKDLYDKGHEIALHLHPQWFNGIYKNLTWTLDNKEYNLCVLTKERITEIVDRSINYLRSVLDISDFSPLSFRAGNWLFQPTQPLADILYSRNIKIDSSVFKGGLQHQNHLDYRPALLNSYYWKFKDNVNEPDIRGKMIEIPIYTEMVPPWRMATKKRMALQQKSVSGKRSYGEMINRALDLIRFHQPLKLDFCRMTITELIEITEHIIKLDKDAPETYKPIVAIGHTKDLVDFKTVNDYLSYLKESDISITTLREAYNKFLLTLTST